MFITTRSFCSRLTVNTAQVRRVHLSKWFMITIEMPCDYRPPSHHLFHNILHCRTPHRFLHPTSLDQLPRLITQGRLIQSRRTLPPRDKLHDLNLFRTLERYSIKLDLYMHSASDSKYNDWGAHLVIEATKPIYISFWCLHWTLSAILTTSWAFTILVTLIAYTAGTE